MIVRPLVSVTCVLILTAIGFTRFITDAVCFFNDCSVDVEKAWAGMVYSLIMLGAGALILERAWYAIFPPK